MKYEKKNLEVPANILTAPKKAYVPFSYNFLSINIIKFNNEFFKYILKPGWIWSLIFSWIRFPISLPKAQPCKIQGIKIPDGTLFYKLIITKIKLFWNKYN